MSKDEPGIPLPHSIHPACRGRRQEGHVPDEQRIRFTVVLKPCEPDHDHPICRKLEEMGAKPPHLRKHLSHAELKEIHAPRPSHIRLIEAFASAHGLTVVSTSEARGEVVLEGSVCDINRAFHIRMGHFKHAGRMHRGHSDPIQIPGPLSKVVEAILDLDDLPAVNKSAAPGSEGSLIPVKDVARAYDFPNPVTGQGQRIAILSYGGGYYRSDLEQYFQETLGTDGPEITDIGVRGASNEPLDATVLKSYIDDVNDPTTTYNDLCSKYGDNLSSAFSTLEATMDIQIAGAVAPGAAIDVYHAPPTAGGIRDSILAAIGLGGDEPDERRKATVISISWGGAESDCWTENSIRAVQQALEKAKHLGVTVVVASGDFGSSEPLGTSVAGVQFPASSKHVLACGGTCLTLREDGSSKEVVFNNPWHGVTLAGGGGVSGFYRKPEYQSQLSLPKGDSGTYWISDSVEDPASYEGRGLPDVAANAVDYRVICAGKPTAGNGTSAATPLWAGLIALVAEKLGQSPGFLNDDLYNGSLSAGFSDVTEGNNDISGGTVPSFDASRGWDACTGWGSPRGRALLQALMQE